MGIGGILFSGSFIDGSDFTSPVTEHQVYHREHAESSQATELVELGSRIAQVRIVLTRENQTVGLVEPREDVQKVQKGDAVQVRASAKQAGNRLERAVANESHGDVTVSK